MMAAVSGRAIGNLTGKSASEVAAVAGRGSQVVTPVEERRALNELNSGLLRVGS